MAKLKLDLRPVLRAIATQVQMENLDRLLNGQGVRGGAVAPRKSAPVPKGTRKRIRLLGVRVKLADVLGKLGVRSGELLKDITRRGNQKIGRTGFKIIPSASVILRWRVFNKGSEHQPPRPVSGITGETLGQATRDVAASARDQFIAALKDRQK